MKHRTGWEIMRDILAVIADERMKKTHIMQRACLDWRKFQRYFTFLLERGFIACAEDENCYYLTEAGNKLLERLTVVNEMLSI
ncbi:MAG: hypothetical protein EFT35_00295 [Methanophagales archaeon ANME-1-THS]|nr:MAG: hypothetical protein EFT35_00295 [Methanophagales archaeon ANME-1-THS]